MEESLSVSLISPGLVACYIFLGLAIVTSIGMPIINAIKNPVGLVKSLIGIVGLVVLFGVAYALSGDEVSVKMAAYGTTASSSKMIGAGMIMFYFILLGAALLAIVSMIKDIISG
jgi:hypothetical protein